MASTGTQIDTGTGPPRDTHGLFRDDGSGRPRPVLPDEPVTLAESLMAEAGWGEANFDHGGRNPPYLRIGAKLWVTLTEYEPCFSSARRDRGLFRSKVSIAAHLERYDGLMVDPIAFEDSYGPGEGTDATFPFGEWLTIQAVTFEGIALRGRRSGRVMLPLEPLRVASAVWLRKGRAG